MYCLKIRVDLVGGYICKFEMVRKGIEMEGSEKYSFFMDNMQNYLNFEICKELNEFSEIGDLVYIYL